MLSAVFAGSFVAALAVDALASTSIPATTHTQRRITYLLYRSLALKATRWREDTTKAGGGLSRRRRARGMAAHA
jgi:hypothetical protein